MTDRPDIDYSRAALALRTAGRRGDSVLAHLTPGEVVVPVSVLRAVPGLDALLAESFGRANLDLGRYTVGGPDDSTNPKTGLPEYYDEEPGDSWGGGDDDWGGRDDWGGGGDPYDFEDKKGRGHERFHDSQPTEFGALSDDGGVDASYNIDEPESIQINSVMQADKSSEKQKLPKFNRTLLTSANIRRSSLAYAEKLGPSLKGKRLLGE